MKQNINLGAYGWRHVHWQGTFYPPDLPADWQLTYYSNEFNCVLVPADYWQEKDLPDCESWLDNVHEDFQFFVECHAGMFDFLDFAEFADCIQALQPQLSGLVFLDEKQTIPVNIGPRFVSLFESLAVDVFVSTALFDQATDIQVKNIWRPEQPQVSSFAFIEHDLSDLRGLRTLVDSFAEQLDKADSQTEQAIIILHHAQIQAIDLSKLRAVIEIMGY